VLFFKRTKMFTSSPLALAWTLLLLLGRKEGSSKLPAAGVVQHALPALGLLGLSEGYSITQSMP